MTSSSGDTRLQQQLEQELKAVLIEELALDDVTVNEIEADAPLFGGGLALDSIDALELALAVERRYGVRLEADDERREYFFGSVRNLAKHILAHGVDRA